MQCSSGLRLGYSSVPKYDFRTNRGIYRITSDKSIAQVFTVSSKESVPSCQHAGVMRPGATLFAVVSHEPIIFVRSRDTCMTVAVSRDQNQS